MLFLRHAREQGVRLPTAEPPDVWNHFGAYVFEPHAGINRNVMYFDLASLYPNIIRGLNISPDTIIGTQEDLEESEYTEDDCVWAFIDTRPVKYVEGDESCQDFTDGKYKMVIDTNSSGSSMKWKGDPQIERCYYVKPSIKEGFVTGVVQDLIDLKYQYSGGMYEAVKRVVNSVFGMMTYLTEHTSGRLSHWMLGESITLAGRQVIQHTSEKAVEWLDNEFDGEVFISHGDTDGVGVACPSAPTRDSCLRAAKEFEDWINTDGYASFMAEEFGVEGEHYMEVETESFAPAVFIPRDFDADNEEVGVRKRYAQYVTWEK